MMKSFRFCKKLFSGLVFFGNAFTGEQSISPCCGEISIGFPRFHYQGEAFDLQAYTAYVAGVQEELQGETALCRGCPHLTERSDGYFPLELDFKPKKVTLVINMDSCNCRCLYCGQRTSAKKVGFSAMPIFNILEKNGLLGGINCLEWSGGEPTFVPDFTVACDYVRTSGLHQTFLTNATVHVPQIARTLQEGKGETLVSLDSGSRVTYRKVKGIDAFDVVVKNLRAYRQAANGDNIALKYVVVEENANRTEIDGFLNLCEALDIRNVAYSCNWNQCVQASSIPDNSVLDAMEYFHTAAEQRDLLCYGGSILRVAQHYLRQSRIRRTQREICQKVSALIGKQILFWGGGEALTVYGDLFARSHPLALLQTLTSSLPSTALTFPVLHSEQFFRERQSRNKLPFVVFCREENKGLFVKSLKPWMDMAEGAVIWCTL